MPKWAKSETIVPKIMIIISFFAMYLLFKLNSSKFIPKSSLANLKASLQYPLLIQVTYHHVSGSTP